jgi:hypothetical protein
MTGPEHDRAAGLLLAEAAERPGEAPARSIVTAQVHAILALAAAAALHGITDHRHWFEATGAQHTDGPRPLADPPPTGPSPARRAWCPAPGVTASYPGSHQGSGGQHFIRSPPQ